MQRVLIAALGAAFLAAMAAPALADDYPPCTQPGQDHCRVTPMRHHGKEHGHHHHQRMAHGAKKR
jgi:Spy/CpxP family protein refolding chaperone